MARVKPLDFIGAIELAYDRSGDERAWLARLAQAIAPAFGTGAGTSCFCFEVVDDEGRVGHTVTAGGERPYGREDYARMHETGRKLSKAPTRVVYDCEMLTLLSRVVGRELASRSIRSAGIDADDALGLRANVTADSGIIVTTHVPRGYRIKDRGLWVRLAAHLGAALRLRRQRPATTPDAASAVLSPRGRLAHVSGDGVVAARDALGQAAQDMDRARGKLRRLDPDAASALWRAMVCGEWSLVDWVDHDGKRFLLAQDNRIPATRRALTPREEQVVACAVMGHSNKLIAYDLGLSTGTVAVILSRAAKKLGVSGRVALIRAFRESRTTPRARR